MINNLDLFAGIGAWHHAGNIVSKVFNYLPPNFLPTISVEINEFVNEIRNKKFTTIGYKDVRDFNIKVENLRFLYMSFPCNGTSQRGKREGLLNKHSSLFWEGLRIVQQSKPKFILIEQPEGIIHNGLVTVVSEIEQLGYKTAVIVLSARAFGLPQRRNRVFVIASDSHDLQHSVYSKQGWSNRFRETFETVRTYALETQIKSGFCEKVNGIYSLRSDYCHDAGIENYKGRHLEINSYAMSIVPYCAAVPIAFLEGINDCF